MEATSLIAEILNLCPPDSIKWSENNPIDGPQDVFSNLGHSDIDEAIDKIYDTVSLLAQQQDVYSIKKIFESFQARIQSLPSVVTLAMLTSTLNLSEQLSPERELYAALLFQEIERRKGTQYAIGCLRGLAEVKGIGR